MNSTRNDSPTGIIERRRVRIANLRKDIQATVTDCRAVYAKHLYAEWMRVHLSLSKAAGRKTISATFLASMFPALGLRSHMRLTGLTSIPPEFAQMRLSDAMLIRAVSGAEAVAVNKGEWFPTPDPILMTVSGNELSSTELMSKAEADECRGALKTLETNLRAERDRIRIAADKVSAEHHSCTHLAIGTAMHIAAAGNDEIQVADIDRLTHGSECRPSQSLRLAEQNVIATAVALFKVGSELPGNPFKIGQVA